MAFFKFRSRGPQANEGRSAPAAVPAESVETLRRRARHRLIGAVVLVLLGVIGFPLLFDTQPRPVAVDIPIEIPDRNRAAPLSVPAPAPKPAPAPSAPTVAATPSAGGVITESADGNEIGSTAPGASVERAPTPAAPPKPEPAPEPPKPEPRPERPKPEVKPEAKPDPKPEARPAPARPQDDGARARALLEGKPPAAAAAAATAAAAPAGSEKAGRFIVQVGAFAEADKAREVRQRLERAGLKTYTTVVKTADGERTRVRVGPYATRAEADQAAGKVKGLSLSASVLSL